jgi:bifunctional non-homologous end joining protein LigD
MTMWTQVDDRRLRLSNLDKVLYPTGFTKGQVIEYYAGISEVMLPHLRGRPMTLKRYPDGVAGGSFFEKNCPSHKPEWVEKAAVAATGVTWHCLIESRAALVWAANLAAIELHPLLGRVEDVDRPTAMALDLDPGEGVGLGACVEVAVELRKMLKAMSLVSYVKSSGGKGLHVYVPLNTEVTYEQSKGFARAAALVLERRSPDRVTSVMAKSQRAGRVFIDWSQNTRTKTTVAVYSMRARDRPTVSTPVTWEEVMRAKRSGKVERLVCEAGPMLERARRMGDVFGEVLTLKQELPRFDVKG